MRGMLEATICLGDDLIVLDFTISNAVDDDDDAQKVAYE
jgi:hypothetical protein